MHTAENETENGSARSFWEPKQYARTVKRLETANKLCSEYALMIQERSDIEKAYASNLRKWSQKWNTFREGGLEYGTGANVFSGLCTEAEQRADLHSTVANSLTESVQSAVKSWQKSKFHKTSISSTIKEVRSLESEFEAAQKVWYKRFKAVHRAQKEYYHACKTVGSLQVQVQNAKNDPNGTAEQQSHQSDKLRKIEEKLSKAEHDKVKTKDAYNHALGNLTDENMHYIDEMTKVFDKAQALEKDRLEFFKSQALEIHKCLDLSKAVQLSDIYKKLEETLNLVDSEADLKQWSFEHGVDMPTNFPKFQEYSPELVPLGHKKRSHVSDTNSAVTLTGVTAAPSSQMPNLPESPTNSYKYSAASGAAPTSTESNLASAGESKADLETPVNQPASSSSPDAAAAAAVAVCRAAGGDDGTPLSDGKITATTATPPTTAAIASSPSPDQPPEAFENKSCGLEAEAGLPKEPAVEANGKAAETISPRAEPSTEANGEETEMISPRAESAIETNEREIETISPQTEKAVEATGKETEAISPPQTGLSPSPLSSSESDIDQISVKERELTVTTAMTTTTNHVEGNELQQQQDLKANGDHSVSSAGGVDGIVATDDTDFGQTSAKVKTESVLSPPAQSDVPA